jgi:hypothetical protein
MAQLSERWADYAPPREFWWQVQRKIARNGRAADHAAALFSIVELRRARIAVAGATQIRNRVETARFESFQRVRDSSLQVEHKLGQIRAAGECCARLPWAALGWRWAPRSETH